MDREFELLEKIKKHVLGQIKEAKALYNSLCKILKEKYGPVDKDYDENPTKRGKEWIDIHHIREYLLDDIASRTQTALYTKKMIKRANKVIVVSNEKMYIDYADEGIALLSHSSWKELSSKEKDEIFSELKKIFPGKNLYRVSSAPEYSLEELQPYNVKEQLVYANKIEHFLLHYLIDSIRGQQIFSGGPNYLWDECVALDYYWFENEYKRAIKSNKETYYSLMSSEEITRLYKKLIDWKKWNLSQCFLCWKTINLVINNLDRKGVSSVENKDKFFSFLNIIGYKLDDETKNKITELPRELIIEWNSRKAKIYKTHLFDLDEKTALVFNIWNFDKAFTVPRYVRRIAEGAFRCGRFLETITIPTTVQKIESNVFNIVSKGIYPNKIWPQIGPIVPVLNTENMSANPSYSWNGKSLPRLKMVIYKGTQQEWDNKFSNVNLDGITLVCKK